MSGSVENSDEQHMALAEEKHSLFLQLADDILLIRQALQLQVDTAFENGMKDTLRNRVLIGLFLKAFDSFERLLVDARDKRGECSHHLKTMAECFIYSHWVSADASELRARLLHADGCRSRAVLHELSNSEKEKEHAVAWRELFEERIDGIEKDWEAFRKKRIQDLASEGAVEKHYNNIYRLACEAAHLGDLDVHMPPHIEATLSYIALLRSYVSLRHGTILACDLLHDASDALGMELDQTIENFRKRTLEIQSKALPMGH